MRILSTFASKYSTSCIEMEYFFSSQRAAFQSHKRKKRPEANAHVSARPRMRGLIFLSYSSNVPFPCGFQAETAQRTPRPVPKHPEGRLPRRGTAGRGEKASAPRKRAKRPLLTELHAKRDFPSKKTSNTAGNAEAQRAIRNRKRSRFRIFMQNRPLFPA